MSTTFSPGFYHRSIFVPSKLTEPSPSALRVLDAMVALYRKRKRGLSNAEVAAALHVSKQTVLKHVKILEQFNLVKRSGVHYGLMPANETPGSSLVHLPILGFAAAGQPIEAVDSDPEMFPVPSEWCRGSCYLLRIRGESMSGDGIQDGDLVLVEATDQVQAGAIHVCWLPGDGATIKRVETKADVAKLVASNVDFVPIEAPRGTIVQGRVIWVFRSLGPKKRRRRA